MPGRFKNIFLRSLIFVALPSVASVVLFEIIGQNYLFKNKLYFVNDVDHYMEPNSSPEINSDGIRCLFEADHFPERDFNIIFLGDSFIYGVRLPYEKSIPCQFEVQARAQYPQKRINVANFGWTSSSPLLSCRLLTKIGQKYHPDLVILAIDMTDFHDDIKYLRFLERQGIYSLLDVTPLTVMAASKFLSRFKGLALVYETIFGFPSRKFFVTDQPLARSLPYLFFIQKNIGDIYQFCRTTLQARFIVVVLPRSYQYSDRESPRNWEKNHYEILGPYAHEPFRFFQQLRAQVDYPIYSLLEDFQKTSVFPTCFDDDPHWNAEGARIASEAIYTYCSLEKVF